ncbi:helix-turn-helix transcriptional regulator [Nocardiopsis suaedae]|uniref:Helix-turn-helix transcriptional regulator n=1 Tax=Nocardiopsis suaedae TaxID=3018444 RepID=A0ABT4TM05_9ACTN|nr:helix-turn-helix transcriptional regulator [Nocardiopsis suaedae]MDA2805734.1 helix-turn-helix transcriptional regulator [Nocardiopsis suaedae]
MASSIGALLRERRQEINVSQSDLAWLARVSRGTVSNLEREKGEAVSYIATSKVASALGVHNEGWRPEGGSLEPTVEAQLLRRMIACILEIRDGVEGAEGDRHAARRIADALTKFVDRFEDEDVFDVDDEARYARDELANAVAIRLDERRPADAAVISFFEDLGWSPDDRLLPQAEYVLENAASRTPESTFDVKRQGALRPERSSSSQSAIYEMLKHVQQRIDQLTEQHMKVVGAFQRLPLRVQHEIMNGTVADSSVTDIAGGTAVQLFMRKDETGVDLVHTILDLKSWEQISTLTQDVFEAANKRGVDLLTDPVAVFDVVQMLLLDYATSPDARDRLKQDNPERYEYLKKQYPDKFPD